MSAYSLLDLALTMAHGPIVGVQRRWPKVLHAVSLDSFGPSMKAWPRIRTVASVCGRRVALVAPAWWWAPAVRGTEWTRCPECEAVCGKRTKKPPRWMRPAEVGS